MIYIFAPFFTVTDCDQNYMQMINLKLTLRNFASIGVCKSFQIFVIVPGVVLKLCYFHFLKKLLRNSFNPAPLVQTKQEDCIFRCNNTI